MVRVLAVSDEIDDGLVADPTAVRGAQLILACGDLPFEYLGSLMNTLDVPLVFVPGNHDPDVSGYRSSRAGLTLKAGLPAPPGRTAPSPPTAGSSTWPACGWPGSAEARATATGRTSTPTGSRPGAPRRCE